MFVNRIDAVKAMSTFPKKDYSAQLEAFKKKMGNKLRCHPDYRPEEHPNHFAPWQVKNFNQ